MIRENWVKLGIIGIVALAPVWLGSEYYLHVAIKMAIWCIAILGLGILVGFAGQVSIAHATFLGVGAYTSSLLALKAGVPFWLCLVVAGLASAMIGVLIGYPFLRLKGHYFAISTLAFCILMEQIFANWRFLTHGPIGVTMGPGQVASIPCPTVYVPFWGVLSFDSKTSYYYLVFFFLVVTTYTTSRLFRSKAGRAMVAMREEEDLAKAVGIDPTKYKLFAFFLSSLFAGIAGSLYAHYVRFLSSGSFSFLESFFMLMAVIMGGRDSIVGIILGAVFINILPEVLSFPASAPMISAISMGILATILILVIIFLPRGFSEFVEIWKTKQHE